MEKFLKLGSKPTLNIPNTTKESIIDVSNLSSPQTSTINEGVLINEEALQLNIGKLAKSNKCHVPRGYGTRSSRRASRD